MIQFRLLRYIGAGSLLFTSACVQKQIKQDLKTKPNVIFIIGDDIGYGDLSCNGEPTIATPNVDRIASQGVRFVNAHCTAATSTPSRYSLLTGHYNWRREDTGIAQGDAAMIIKPEQYTMADLFREAGYTTAAIGKWHLGLGDKQGEQNWNEVISPGPSDIGFDYSYLMAATGDRVPCVYVENQRVVGLEKDSPIEVSFTSPFPGEPLGKDHPELLTVMKPSKNHGHDQAIVNGISRIGYMKGGVGALWVDENIADSITNRAVRFIKQNREQPFFLYFATNDIHVPRVPHPRFKGKSGMGYRGDAIIEFDWSVGQILDAVKQSGIEDNTIIIITSDNGPVVDDGYQDQAVELLGEHRPWGDFRGGKYSNFEAGTRIPLIVYYPHVSSPKISEALVSHIDFISSFAKFLDIELSGDKAPDSNDYWDTFIGNDSRGREYIIASGGALSISNREWKYIEKSNGARFNKLTNTELGNDTIPQFYNLLNDIGEKKNIYNEKKEELKGLIRLLDNEKRKKPTQ